MRKLPLCLAIRYQTLSDGSGITWEAFLMKAEKIFVKLSDVKFQFYHKYRDREFNLHHYETVASAITAWLEVNRPNAVGGFWNGEMNLPSEVAENLEIRIVYFE